MLHRRHINPPASAKVKNWKFHSMSNMATPRTQADESTAGTSTSEPETTPNEPRAGVFLDVADDISAPVPGWPLLAKAMGDNAAFKVFPTFNDLNMKNLLYYQAELDYLRRRLHKAEWRDYRTPSDEETSFFASNFEFLFLLRDEALADNQTPPEQWVLMNKIREALKEYSE
jgi:hypothetical protein